MRKTAQHLVRISDNGLHTPSAVSMEICWFLSCLVLLLAPAAKSHAQEQKLWQMIHTAWTAKDGAPQTITRLAEGVDGRLWIGTNNGLFTFDGRSFTLFRSPQGEDSIGSRVSASLCASPDGSIWVSTTGGGVARIRDGHVRLYRSADGESLSFVRNLQSTHDGRIFAVNKDAYLIAFGADDKWHKAVSPPSGAGVIWNLFIDSRDTFWVVKDVKVFGR